MKKQIVCCTAALLLAAGGLGALPQGTFGSAIVASAYDCGFFHYDDKDIKTKDGFTYIIWGKDYAGDWCDFYDDSGVYPDNFSYFYGVDPEKFKADCEGAIEILDYKVKGDSFEFPDEIDGHKVRFVESAPLKNSKVKKVELPKDMYIFYDHYYEYNDEYETDWGTIEYVQYALQKIPTLTDVEIENGDGAGFYSENGALFIDHIPWSRRSKDYFNKKTLSFVPISKTDFIIPSDVVVIDDDAFSYNKMKSVTIPENVEYIRFFAFNNCPNLKIVDIQAHIKILPSLLFYNDTKLTSVTLPDTLEVIEGDAFFNCSSLKSLCLPASINKIEDYAFGYIYSKDKYSYELIDGFTLYCYPGVGEKYAKNNKINYKLINGDVTNAKIKLTKGDYYVYQGKAIRPAVKVTLDGKTLKANTDYKVVYKKNDAPGKASVVVKGAGSYTGRAVKKFFIKPATSKIMKVTSPKNGAVKLSWKRDTLSDGYVLYVSYNNFKSVAKKVYIKKNATAAKTITGLRSGRKCYVKMRAYKLVDGKKLTGKCSKVVTVKCK